jgi:hypothetical protein
VPGTNTVRWLELDFGVEAIRADGRTETAVGVLFKKSRFPSEALPVSPALKSCKTKG